MQDADPQEGGRSREDLFDEALEEAFEEGELERGADRQEDAAEPGRAGPAGLREPDGVELSETDVQAGVAGVDYMIRLTVGAPLPEGLDLDLSHPQDRLEWATRQCMPAARKYSRTVSMAPEIRAGVAILVLAVMAWIEAPDQEDGGEAEEEPELPEDVRRADGDGGDEEGGADPRRPPGGFGVTMDEATAS